ISIPSQGRLCLSRIETLQSHRSRPSQLVWGDNSTRHADCHSSGESSSLSFKSVFEQLSIIRILRVGIPRLSDLKRVAISNCRVVIYRNAIEANRHKGKFVSFDLQSLDFERLAEPYKT